MISQTGSSPRDPRLQAGFTLLELLIVLVILSVVAAFSIPRFGRTFSHLQFEVLSYKVAKLLEVAGQGAIATGNRMRVHFDPEDRRYQLLQAQGVPPESPFEPIPGRVGQLHTLPDSVFLSPTTPDVTFYPDGTADPFQLLILDHQRNGYRLVTHVWTGHVRLIRAEGVPSS